VGESPREAIEATLGLVARELTEEGFQLKPGPLLRRKREGQGHVIHCQSSKWNRSGEFAGFRLTAWFESDILSSWTKKRWPGRPTEIEKYDRVVSSMQIKRAGNPHHVEWDAVDPASRSEIAADVASLIREQALPWFEMMSDPVTALSELVRSPIPSPPVVHYAIATGHSEDARRSIAALREANVHFAKVLDDVRRNGKPPAYRNAFEPIAWAAVECGIA